MRPQALSMVRFCKRQKKYPHLLSTNPRKKMVEKKSEKIKWTEKEKDVDNFFSAKRKLVDLHVEESVVI